MELQSRRDDMPRLQAYLNQRRLLFSINHAFSGLTGERTEADFEDFATIFPAMEVRNGQMLEAANRFAAAFAERTGRIPMGGSDAHTLAGLGKTYTTVHGAGSTVEFIEGLKHGRCEASGDSGNIWKLTQAVLPDRYRNGL